MNILFDLAACSVETSKILDIRIDRGPNGDSVVILTGDTTIRSSAMLPELAESYAEHLRGAVVRARQPRAPQKIYVPPPPQSRLIPSISASSAEEARQASEIPPRLAPAQNTIPPQETFPRRQRGRPPGSKSKKKPE